MKLFKIALPLITAGILALGFRPDRGTRDLVEWKENLKVNWDDYKGGITDTVKIASSNCGIYCIPQVIGDSASITLIAYLNNIKFQTIDSIVFSVLHQNIQTGERFLFNLTVSYQSTNQCC